MFKSFLTLFSEASWLFYVLLIFSFSLCLIQLLNKENNIAGIGGICMIFVTIAERCNTGINSANQIIFYIFYIIVLNFLFIVITKAVLKLKERKKGVKYAIIDGNKVPLTLEGNPDYSFIIGEEGEVLSDLKPMGKVRFESGVFEATSTKEYIYEGTWVKADRILNGKIVVKRK